MSPLTALLKHLRSSDFTPTAASSNPFHLTSSLAEAARGADVSAAWPSTPLPADFADLWRECRSARLFEDKEYGQWGLVLLDPETSAARTMRERLARQDDVSGDDIVIGEFLGDQELLIVAPGESGVRRMLVALPLDARTDWYGAGADLVSFLERYIKAGGEKFWEQG